MHIYTYIIIEILIMGHFKKDAMKMKNVASKATPNMLEKFPDLEKNILLKFLTYPCNKIPKCFFF